MSDEAALVRRCLRGDGEAIRTLVERFQAEVFGRLQSGEQAHPGLQALAGRVPLAAGGAGRNMRGDCGIGPVRRAVENCLQVFLTFHARHVLVSLSVPTDEMSCGPTMPRWRSRCSTSLRAR